MKRNMKKRYEIKSQLNNAYLILNTLREEHKEFMTESELNNVWNVEQELLKVLRTIQFNNEVLEKRK